MGFVKFFKKKKIVLNGKRVKKVAVSLVGGKAHGARVSKSALET